MTINQAFWMGAFGATTPDTAARLRTMTQSEIDEILNEWKPKQLFILRRQMVVNKNNESEIQRQITEIER